MTEKICLTKVNGLAMPKDVFAELRGINGMCRALMQEVLNKHKGELYVADWTCASHFTDDNNIDEQVVIEFATKDYLDNRIESFGELRIVDTDFYLCDRETAHAIAEEELSEILRTSEVKNKRP